MLNCRAKNEVKRSNHTGDVLCKRISNLIDRETFGPKTHEPDCLFALLEITE